MRRLVIFVFAVFLTAACSSGVAAPDVTAVESVCTQRFCVDIPAGWTGEISDTFVSLHHEADPENTHLTIGVVNMQAIVEAAGGTWPVPTPEVVRSFWDLLEEAGSGDFQRSERVLGGAERAWGTHEGKPMWYLLDPTGGGTAVAAEVRGPNDTWESHANAVFGSLETTG